MAESSESTLQIGQVDDGSEYPEEHPLRRSKLTRILTEKGKAMQEDKIRALQQRFDYINKKWRTH